jgi:hypothetical protein
MAKKQFSSGTKFTAAQLGIENNLCGLSLRANYTDRATAEVYYLKALSVPRLNSVNVMTIDENEAVGGMRFGMWN